MTDARFCVLVALPLIGILLNVGLTLRLSVSIDRMGDRLVARLDELAARIARLHFS